MTSTQREKGNSMRCKTEGRYGKFSYRAEVFKEHSRWLMERPLDRQKKKKKKQMQEQLGDYQQSWDKEMIIIWS